MTKLSLLFPLGALAALVFGGAAAQPAPAVVEKAQTISATVESIDKEKRLVQLRKGDDVKTVQVPEEVQNFDRIKVGDEVVATYYQALAAEFKKKGEGTPAGVVDATTGTARMPKGSTTPGAAVANKVTATVVIEGVDKAKHSVSFVGPSGMTRTVDVKDPDAQKFVASLKKGDEVQLTYVEALAVTLEPKKK